MSNKVYDCLKWVSQILLPALATLYFALANIWGLPYAEQIVGTIAAIDAFLGVVLGISSKSYYKQIKDIVNKEDTEQEENTITNDYTEGEEIITSEPAEDLSPLDVDIDFKPLPIEDNIEEN